MMVAGFVLLGLVAAFFGSMAGVGGGFLIIPALLLFFGMSAEQAVAVSLAGVLANGISSTIAYARQRRVDFRSGLVFAALAIPGSIAGTFIVRLLPVRAFSGAFGALFTVMAWLVLATPWRRTPPRQGDGALRAFKDSHGIKFRYRVRMGAGVLVSFVAGMLSSLFGIGGGVLHGPAMILWLGFPQHIAVATSHLVIMVSALTGTVSFALQGAVDWSAALPVAAGAFVGAQAGAACARRVSARLISVLLALALGFVGLRMLIFAWWH